jgi:lipopolysaccharide transport system permease protein
VTSREGSIPSGGGWRINASRTRAVLRLGDLWRARDLLFFLARRDVKVRYAQTFLGAAWALLQPALMMLVFTLVFGRLIGTPTGDVPYPLFAIAGLLPWQLFSVTLADVSNSVIANDRLLTKAAFPRIVLPVAAAAPGVIDAGVAALLLAVLLVHYGVLPGVAVLFAPLFLLLGLAASLGIGLWLAALNLRYRDVRYAIPFMLQLGLFLTPVAYPASAVPEWARTLYALNPMSSIVEGFRWSVLGTEPPSLSMLLASASVLLLSIVGGAAFFRRAERTFADVA